MGTDYHTLCFSTEQACVLDHALERQDRQGKLEQERAFRLAKVQQDANVSMKQARAQMHHYPPENKNKIKQRKKKSNKKESAHSNPLSRPQWHTLP